MRFILFAAALGAVALLPTAAQASNGSMQLGNCTLHAYEPHYVRAPQIQAHGAIYCNADQNTLELETCLQVWGSGTWWTKTCGVIGWPGDGFIYFIGYSPVTTDAVCGHSYRTLVWGDDNGITAWYAFDQVPWWTDCQSAGTARDKRLAASWS